jgi:hypothetical protein
MYEALVPPALPLFFLTSKNAHAIATGREKVASQKASSH